MIRTFRKLPPDDVTEEGELTTFTWTVVCDCAQGEVESTFKLIFDNVSRKLFVTEVGGGTHNAGDHGERFFCNGVVTWDVSRAVLLDLGAESYVAPVRGPLGSVTYE